MSWRIGCIEQTPDGLVIRLSGDEKRQISEEDEPKLMDGQLLFLEWDDNDRIIIVRTIDSEDGITQDIRAKLAQQAIDSYRHDSMCDSYVDDPISELMISLMCLARINGMDPIALHMIAGLMYHQVKREND